MYSTSAPRAGPGEWGVRRKRPSLHQRMLPKGRTETGASLTCRIIAVGHACRNCFAEMRKTMRGIFSADIEPAELFLYCT